MNSGDVNIGFYLDGIWHLSPKECFEICKSNGVMVDVREEYMNRFKQFAVENIIYCPFSLFSKTYRSLPAGNFLILADASGINSKKALLFLKNKGFTLLANLAGGLVEWERDGLPLVIDKSERLRGSCMCQLKFRDKNK
jgi:rhodanese-related sulfurtransferase